MVFVSEALNETHDTSHFDSGQPDLDLWFQKHALQTEARRTGRTFVWQADKRVVGYYTIAAHLIMRADMPPRCGRGNPSQTPAVMLGRLALDKTLHGRGHGGALLADALHRIVVATRSVAARYVVVDAVDATAHGFYRHHGFQEIPGSMRLVQKVSDVAAALGLQPSSATMHT